MSAEDQSIQRRFIAHLDANPHVYSTLVDLAREAVSRGRRRIGIKMLWEVMRWRMFLETSDPEGWKMNNTYSSRYARIIMQREPDLAGIFELRELRSI